MSDNEEAQVVHFKVYSLCRLFQYLFIAFGICGVAFDMDPEPLITGTVVLVSAMFLSWAMGWHYAIFSLDDVEVEDEDQEDGD